MVIFIDNIYIFRLQVIHGLKKSAKSGTAHKPGFNSSFGSNANFNLRIVSTVDCPSS